MLSSAGFEPTGTSMDETERELRRLRMQERHRRSEIELAEADLDRGQRSILDALADWAQRGTVIECRVANATVVGRIGHLGASVVTIDLDDGSSVLVALDHLEGVGETAVPPRPGPWKSGHPGSMVAALRAGIEARPEIEITRPMSDPVRGRLVGVSSTMVELARIDGGASIVPIGAITTCRLLEPGR